MCVGVVCVARFKLLTNESDLGLVNFKFCGKEWCRMDKEILMKEKKRKRKDKQSTCSEEVA